jgi:hypothetical protein
MREPSTLDRLTKRLGLTAFERDVLLVLLGECVDPAFAERAAAIGGICFALAMHLLPSPHWSAITPQGSLRRWGLVRMGPGSVTTARLSLDEAVLHVLVGVGGMSATTRDRITELPRVPSGAASEILDRARAALSPDADTVLIIHGDGEALHRRLAAHAAAPRPVWAIDAGDVPTTPTDRAALARDLTRDALLNDAVLLLDLRHAAAPHREAAIAMTRSLGAPVGLSSAVPVRVPGRRTVPLELDLPDDAVRRAHWVRVLASERPIVDRLASQFRLDADDIDAIVRTTDSTDDEALWSAARQQARPDLGDLAHRLVATVGWNDLVLPSAQLDQLRQIASHVQHRFQVYQRWGFAARSGRGLGMAALFAGPSGTGKTLAAEVIANELGLDCLRVDLSTVVSKYIGETESNLRRVFDAAERGGAVIVFDEADALFAKRHEVRDSRDRYANLETGYLLQRLESYRGLAVLTTNLRDNIDEAFQRRLRFSVRFPFPDQAHRAEIWRRVLPKDAPRHPRLTPELLSKLALSGGHIRTVALNAAFLAAEARAPISPQHVLSAAESEYAKLGRRLSASEVSGWK